MTYPRIEAAVDTVIKEKPLYYNQKGLDRLTKKISDTMPKLVVDRIIQNPTGIGYSHTIQCHYE